MPRSARECAKNSEDYCDDPPPSASASQARANAQCRSAVRRGMPRASAASPSVIPAKNRSFTNLGGYGELVRQPVEGVVEFEEVVVGGGGRAGEPVEVDPAPARRPASAGRGPGRG